MLGALAIVALLVGAGFLLVLPSVDDATGREGVQSEQVLSTPDAVVAEASRVLPTLVAAENTALAATIQAETALETAARAAQSQVINEAMAQASGLQSVVSSATGLGLPSVPASYVVGTDVSGYLGAAGSVPYAVSVLDVPGTVGGATSLAESTVGGSFVTGGAAPRTGVPEVDSLMQQAGLIDAAYGTLLGQDLNHVLAGLGHSLPVPVGVPIPGGLPTDGLLPAMPGADAGAVDPDDEGAANALTFGYGLTDGVTGAFAGLSSQASAVLVDQAALVAQVNELATEVRSMEAEGTASILAQLEDRIAAAGTDAQARIDALLAARDAFQLILLEAHASAQAAVLAALDASQAELQAAADQQVQILMQAAEATQAEAVARVAALDAQTQAYLELLARMEANGADVALQVADVQAQATELRQQALAIATEQEATLLTAAANVEAQATGLVADVQVPNFVDLDAQLAAASAEVDRALAFGQALALAGAAATVAVHEANAVATVDALQAAAQAEVDNVRTQALAYLDRTTDLAASGQALVEQLQADGTAHLDLAVGYVEKVAGDYATVPAPERQAAADALLADAELLLGVGTGAVDSGMQVFAQFGAVARSATTVQAQVLALAL